MPLVFRGLHAAAVYFARSCTLRCTHLHTKNPPPFRETGHSGAGEDVKLAGRDKVPRCD